MASHGGGKKSLCSGIAAVGAPLVARVAGVDMKSPEVKVDGDYEVKEVISGM